MLSTVQNGVSVFWAMSISASIKVKGYRRIVETVLEKDDIDDNLYNDQNVSL